MPERNGTAHPGVLTLPDIAYERAPVRTTINGEPFSADGWVNGPGCPGRVKAEFARIRRRFAESTDAVDAAYHEFLTDALRAVFEADAGRYDDIDLLAGETSRAEQVLTHLKWFEAPAEGEDTADPEAGGEDGDIDYGPILADLCSAYSSTPHGGGWLDEPEGVMLAAWEQIDRVRAIKTLDAAQAAMYPHLGGQSGKSFLDGLLDRCRGVISEAREVVEEVIWNGKPLGPQAFKREWQTFEQRGARNAERKSGRQIIARLLGR